VPNRTRFAASARMGFPARWLGLVIGLMLVSILAVLAQPAQAADEDPPGRVGRLSEVNGTVWVYAPESGEWIAASRNRPVTTGDRLSTDKDGRAEIRVGSTTLRVAANTELEVLQIDDDHLSLQLHSGSLAARLRSRETARQFGVATGEGRFLVDRGGSYRFDRTDDTSQVTVVNGQAQFEGDRTALTVLPGQRAEFWRDPPEAPTQYSITEPVRDGFSDWVASLDQRDDRSVSTRYVSPEMTGVEDLDRYGRWEQSPDYGAIWIPRNVAPDWAPYRMGHWAWISPWGWTWVDDAPWGFAPFHYGRWVWHRSAWCWSPGTYIARPVYAPALVAWVGGPSLSVSISAGYGPSVGWFPLAPREVYVPSYHVSPRYVRNVNVTHVTNITNVTNIINSPGAVVQQTNYINRGMPHAVTVVPATVMERRQPVAPALARVNDRTLRDIIRERPRADAPVAIPTPPPGAAGVRRIEDPRNGRISYAPNPLAPVPAPPGRHESNFGRDLGGRNGRDGGRGGDTGWGRPEQQRPAAPQQQVQAPQPTQQQPLQPTPQPAPQVQPQPVFTPRPRPGRDVPDIVAPPAGANRPPANAAQPSQQQPQQQPQPVPSLNTPDRRHPQPVVVDGERRWQGRERPAPVGDQPHTMPRPQPQPQMAPPVQPQVQRPAAPPPVQVQQPMPPQVQAPPRVQHVPPQQMQPPPQVRMPEPQRAQPQQPQQQQQQPQQQQQQRERQEPRFERNGREQAR